METFPYSEQFKSIPESQWDALSDKRIYFGHQSVGYNLIQGIEDIMGENERVKLTIIETVEQKQTGKGVLVHSKVGINEDPESKIRDFALRLDQGVGNGLDIAFFKLCYVDISPSTDAQKIFSLYKTTLGTVRKSFSEEKHQNMNEQKTRIDRQSMGAVGANVATAETGFREAI